MTYEAGGSILSETVKENDLGVTMNGANMKDSEQCRIVASKGNQVLGMIRRNITYKDKSLIVPMCGERWTNGLERWTGDRVVLGSNPAAATLQAPVARPVPCPLSEFIYVPCGMTQLLWNLRH